MKSVFTLQEFATIFTAETSLWESYIEVVGEHEIDQTSLKTARSISNKLCMEFQGKSLDEVLPNFDNSYNTARKMAMKGIFSRKDMPVITQEDIEKMHAFLKSGHADKDEKDARVIVTNTRVSRLQPLQKQIYLEKGIYWIAKDGPEAQAKKLKNMRLVVSRDDKIIDGHHRWLTGMLIDVNLTVNIFQIDLNWQDLRDMMLKYSDYMGRKRNV